MAFGEDVPVHAPLVGVPVTGLCGGFRGAVDAGVSVSERTEAMRRLMAFTGLCALGDLQVRQRAQQRGERRRVRYRP